MVLEKNPHPDYVLFGIISILVVWGIFQVASVSFPFSLEKFGNPWYYFWHQILMLIIAITLGLAFFKVSIKTLKKFAPFFFLFNLILVFLVFFPKIGVEIGGARRWLNFGGFLLQPSEFLKISFIIYLAAWLAERSKIQQKEKEKLKHLFLPFLIILSVLLITLLAQPDMSTLGIIFITGILMYFAAFTPWWHTLIFVAGAGGGAFFLIKTAPYRLARLLVFLHPETDPLGIGYQLRQALIAIGSGKVFGIENGFAFGLSRQKFGFLPHPMTDSIFAIIGEELGFFGCTLLITFFLLFAWQGLKVAQKTDKIFEKLLALGIILWITIQAFFNIGGMIGILPLAGIPLPFFSYGGSHLIAEMIGVGILLNISKQ
jgi:cell division protein FtsW